MLKRALTSAPILVAPDPSVDFVVCMAASLDCIGAVPILDGKPISYKPSELKTHELNYATHDLEIIIIFHSLVRW